MCNRIPKFIYNSGYMKKLLVVTLLSLLVATTVSYASYAYNDDYERYYQERRQMEEAELEARQNEADMNEYELESKVAAYEDEQERSQKESDESFVRFLMYIGIGIAGLFAITYITHLLGQLQDNKK